MILVNGEILKINDKTSPLATEIRKHRDYLKKEIGFPVVFRFPDKYFKKTEDGQIETPGAKRYTTKLNFHGERGSEEIIYCARYWRDANDNIVHYPHHVIIDKTLIVQEKDWDLAVFMRFFNNEHGKSYELIDNKAKHAKKIKNRKLQARVQSIINTPDEVGFSLEKLRIVALGYGISSENNDEMQNMLWDQVYAEQIKSKKGFRNFLNTVEQNDLLLIKANLHKAISSNLIKNYSGHKQTWSYVKADGEMGAAIMRYKTEVNAVMELAEYYQHDKKAFQQLIELLGSDAITITKPKEKS